MFTLTMPWRLVFAIVPPAGQSRSATLLIACRHTWRMGAILCVHMHCRLLDRTHWRSGAYVWLLRQSRGQHHCVDICRHWLRSSRCVCTRTPQIYAHRHVRRARGRRRRRHSRHITRARYRLNGCEYIRRSRLVLVDRVHISSSKPRTIGERGSPHACAGAR